MDSRSPPPTSFTYERLDPPDALRILELLPPSEEWNGLPALRMRQRRPSEPYRCLSYMWGDQTERFDILVNQKLFSVGRNLYDFLLHWAGRPEASQPLWIDAICINQTDNDEKSVQVQRMGDLFSQGEETIIWLGPGTETDTQAMRWIQTVETTVIHDDSWTKLESIVECWEDDAQDNLESFFSQDYWRRARIVQEVVLSRRIVILSGPQTLDAEVLLRPPKWTNWYYLIGEYRFKCEYPQAYETDRHIWSLGPAVRRLDSMPGFVVLTLRSQRGNDNGYLPNCFCMYNGPWLGNCSDPRDRIFSILSLVKQHEGASCIVRADYSRSAKEVFDWVWEAEERHLQELQRNIDTVHHVTDFAAELKGALALEDDETTRAFVASVAAQMFQVEERLIRAAQPMECKTFD
ncbi:hypothetical protein SLS60_000276 [Paraconiothyrium brasiliense]|uniref:Heterokaryon incompatibility domain-containing protein n=1 Tax=Paraconiothyrium brasiliense TaxID=300254 RepID=A0ABR3S5U5_9PLEO